MRRKNSILQRLNSPWTPWLVLLTLVLPLACTKKQEVNKNTLVVALSAAPKTLDPRFATDANGMRIGSLLFNSLVKVGPDLKVTGDAAKSWDFKDNTYTFKLQKGLSFDKNRPLTPEDIQFSFEQYQQDNNPFHSAFKNIEKVEVWEEDGQLVVSLKLKEFSATFLTSDLPVVKLLPKKETLEAGKNFSKAPLGTGSFRFQEQTANEIRLTANKTHPFAPPKSDHLLFKIIRDDFTRFQKTLKGEVDIVQSEMPANKVSEFRKRPDDFSFYKYPGLSMSYILINLEDSILKDQKVREALARAINREEIIQFKLEGLATAATSILTPNNPFFNDELNNPPYSLEKAKALVPELRGTEITLKTSNNQAAVEHGKVIANQLGKIGLKVKLQSYEWGTFYGDIKNGNFQLATMRWVGALDPDIYRIAFHSKEKPPGRNRGRYDNKVLDVLLDEGLHISDPAQRVKHYKKVQKIVHEELPIIPLWYDQQVAIANKTVKNYKPPQNGDFSSLVTAYKE